MELSRAARPQELSSYPRAQQIAGELKERIPEWISRVSGEFTTASYGIVGKCCTYAERLLKNVFPLLLHGKTFLVRVRKKVWDILPLFVLKNSIRIKPRLGFYKTWDDMQNERINILNKSVEKALSKI